MCVVNKTIKDDLPLRPIARVLIVRDGRLCLAHVTDHKGIVRNYQYPGGSKEDDETYEEAAKREALEEVGIKIKNIRPLGYNIPLKHFIRNAIRSQLYSGSDTHYYIADYDSEDHSIMNIAGDAMCYEWLTPFEAWVKIDTGPPVPYNIYKLKALNIAWGLIGSTLQCA